MQSPLAGFCIPNASPLPSPSSCFATLLATRSEIWVLSCVPER